MRIASADNAARIRRRRRGAAAVELAIVLPVLMVIVVGCVDFGRFLYYYIAVTNAAEEGAAFGSLNPPANYGVSGGTSSGWETAVQNAAVGEAPGLRMNGSSAPISASNVTVVDPPQSGVVQVTVSYTFQTILQYPWLPQNVIVSRTVAMPFTR
jgi:Flp pilus assembly protein TadG